jgi:small subunit ribosomal protein S16
MVRIRLSRAGAKNNPFYHIVVADSRNRRDGRYIERVGFFNPDAQGGEERLRLNDERIAYWKAHGARPSERVVQLIRQKAKAPAAATE